MNVVISYDGTDITDKVIVASAQFKSAAKGVPGTCEFTVKDLGWTEEFVTGKPLSLEIDGRLEWAGFVGSVGRSYFFDVDDPECDGMIPRGLIITGVDNNILLNKRFLYNKTTPAKMDLTSFPAGTLDKTIIEAYFQHTDLPSDGVVLAVEAVDTPVQDAIFHGSASWSFNQFLSTVGRHIGSIWYIRPAKILTYTDVDSPSLPYTITDHPTGPNDVGCQRLEITMDGTHLVNDALIWGAGQGADEVVFRRVEDAASIAAHGRWQAGQFNVGVWKQSTVDKIADSFVYGSPQNRRGAKDDAPTVRCRVFTPGFQVAHKVTVRSDVHGFTDVLPIRAVTITFASPTEAIWDLTLSHEIDDPFQMFDPIPFPDFDFILPPIIEIPPWPTPCLPRWTYPIDYQILIHQRVINPTSDHAYDVVIVLQSQPGDVGQSDIGVLLENDSSTATPNMVMYTVVSGESSSWDGNPSGNQTGVNLTNNATDVTRWVRVRLEGPRGPAKFKAWFPGNAEPDWMLFQYPSSTDTDFVINDLGAIFLYFATNNDESVTYWEIQEIQINEGYGGVPLRETFDNREVASGGWGMSEMTGGLWQVEAFPGPAGPNYSVEQGAGRREREIGSGNDTSDAAYLVLASVESLAQPVGGAADTFTRFTQSSNANGSLTAWGKAETGEQWKIGGFVQWSAPGTMAYVDGMSGTLQAAFFESMSFGQWGILQTPVVFGQDLVITGRFGIFSAYTWTQTDVSQIDGFTLAWHIGFDPTLTESGAGVLVQLEYDTQGTGFSILTMDDILENGEGWEQEKYRNPFSGINEFPALAANTWFQFRWERVAGSHSRFAFWRDGTTWNGDWLLNMVQGSPPVTSGGDPYWNTQEKQPAEVADLSEIQSLLTAPEFGGGPAWPLNPTAAFGWRFLDIDLPENSSLRLRWDDIRVGSSDGCLDLPGLLYPIQLPSGWTCSNLARIGVPSGQDSTRSYFSTGVPYLKDQTEVWVDGIFIPPSKYIQNAQDGWIGIHSSINVGGDEARNPSKAVRMCYLAMPSWGGV